MTVAVTDATTQVAVTDAVAAFAVTDTPNQVVVSEEKTYANTDTPNTVLVADDSTTVIGESANQILLTQESITVITGSGIQGPQGPPGPSGGTDFTAIAAQALGGQRVVVINASGQADYATNLTSSHKWLSVGITTVAVSSGAQATLRTTGLLTEPTWSWTAGAPVYLSTNGLLTQTTPSFPSFIRVIGVATSPTTIFIQPQPAIALIA